MMINNYTSALDDSMKSVEKDPNFFKVSTAFKCKYRDFNNISYIFSSLLKAQLFLWFLLGCYSINLAVLCGKR